MKYDALDVPRNNSNGNVRCSSHLQIQTVSTDRGL